MHKWDRLRRAAAHQHGLVTVTQADRLGISRWSLARHGRERGWERLHTGVYALPGSAWSYERSVMAAVLAVGPPAFAASRAAAHLWGLTRTRPTPVPVVVPYRRTPRRTDGIRVHRSRTLSRGDVGNARQVPVTRPARTLRDFAADAGVDELREAVALAVQRRLLLLPEVLAALERSRRAKGAARLRRVVDELAAESGTSGRTDSYAERLGRRVLTGGGLNPYPGVFPLTVDGRVVAYLDIAFPQQRVFVEVDGYWWHSRPDALRTDHVRLNEIVACDWMPLRTGVRELTERPERFLRQARRVLAARGYPDF